MRTRPSALLFTLVIAHSLALAETPPPRDGGERRKDNAAAPATGTAAIPNTGLTPGPIHSSLRADFDLAPFYQKHVLVGGLPIVGSEKVHDAALSECAWIVSRMLEKRPDILQALAARKVRFAIMAHSEYTTDIPEHARLIPRVYWDRRARGLGATPDAPAVSAGEESLLAFPGDPYPREIIAIHEFAHAIHEVALRKLDPLFDRRLMDCFKKATAAGLWKSTYAASNRMEYWAEAVQAWFDNNDTNNALHNHVDTRAELEAYDPDVAALCREVFGANDWRYAKPSNRSAADRAHLEGFDPAKAPRFEWKKETTPERPQISIDCPAGNMVFELTGPDDQLAKFLAQAHRGFFSSGKMALSEDRAILSPGSKASDGSPIPADAGRWTFSAGKGSETQIGFTLIKGAEIAKKLQSDRAAAAEDVPIQRVVRLN